MKPSALMQWQSHIQTIFALQILPFFVQNLNKSHQFVRRIRHSYAFEFQHKQLLRIFLWIQCSENLVIWIRWIKHERNEWKIIRNEKKTIFEGIHDFSFLGHCINVNVQCLPISSRRLVAKANKRANFFMKIKTRRCFLSHLSPRRTRKNCQSIRIRANIIQIITSYANSNESAK